MDGWNYWEKEVIKGLSICLLKTLFWNCFLERKGRAYLDHLLFSFGVTLPPLKWKVSQIQDGGLDTALHFMYTDASFLEFQRILYSVWKSTFWNAELSYLVYYAKNSFQSFGLLERLKGKELSKDLSSENQWILWQSIFLSLLMHCCAWHA